MKQVLANPQLLRAFEEFLISELGVESLLFLQHTDQWKKTYYDITPSARLARGRRLYQTYIAPTGPLPVNVPSYVINNLESLVTEISLQDVPENIFDEAREEIEELLQAGAVARFQKSKEFQNLEVFL